MNGLHSSTWRWDGVGLIGAEKLPFRALPQAQDLLCGRVTHVDWMAEETPVHELSDAEEQPTLRAEPVVTKQASKTALWVYISLPRACA